MGWADTHDWLDERVIEKEPHEQWSQDTIKNSKSLKFIVLEILPVFEIYADIENMAAA